METLWQDIRYGLRMLARKPGFTAVAVLTLALGIGANTAIFTVVNSVLLQPLPYPEPDRLIFLNEHPPNNKEMVFSVSIPALRSWTEQNRVFEKIGGFRRDNFNLTGRGEPERIRGEMVSGGFFETVGVPPQLGRTFTPGDDQPGAAPTVVLSHRLWQRLFGANPNILGESVLFNGRAFTVIGVMPPDFRFSSRDTELWTPLNLFLDQFAIARGNHPGLWVIGRMKPGITLTQVRADMDRIARNIEEETGFKSGVVVRSLMERVVGQTRPALLALLGAVGLVLLIACANIANLLLARAAGREKEIAIRAALGATPGRVIQQLLTENILLSMLGGAAGLLLGLWGVDLLLALLPASTPRLHEINLNAVVLLFSFVVSVGTGVLFGAAPARQSSQPDLHTSLKESGRGSTSGSRQRLRSLLVIFEVALSLMLLISAGLMIRSFFRLMNVDPGFVPEHTLSMRFSLPPAKYPTTRVSHRFYKQLLERVQALPGVQSAAISSGVPFLYVGNETGFAPEGEELSLDNFYFAQEEIVSRDYFHTLGVQLLRGRTFTEQDTEDTPAVTVVDETLVRRLFPDQNPIGKRLQFGSQEERRFLNIVGVVRHVRSYELRSEGYYQVYTSLKQTPSWDLNPQDMSLTLRTAGNPLSLVDAVRALVRDLDPNQPVFNVTTMTRVVEGELSGQRLYLYLFGFFAASALLLAAVGVYGVVSYSVEQRTREIGIRLALGAQKRDIFQLVVKQGMVLAAIGIGIGLAGAFAATRVLSSLLVDVSVTDPATFVSIPVLLGAVALLACYIPARRATRVDPMVALRYE